MVRLSNQMARLVLETYQEDPSPEAATMLEVIRGQLYEDHSDEDLFNGLLDMLTDPDRTHIAASQLDRIRRSILRPDEWRKWLAEKQVTTSLCSNCGREFAEFEAITHAHGGDDKVFFCSRCVTPTQVPCSTKGCARSVSLGGDATSNWLQRKVYCSEHSGVKEKPSIDRLSGENPFSSYTTVRMEDIGTVPVQRFTPPPPDVQAVQEATHQAEMNRRIGRLMDEERERIAAAQGGATGGATGVLPSRQGRPR